MNNQQEKTVLETAYRLYLKKMAHHLDPVIRLGKKGVTEPLLIELEGALTAHELIKLHMSAKQKEEFEKNLELILAKTGAFHIDTIGNMVILFRKREENSAF